MLRGVTNDAIPIEYSCIVHPFTFRMHFCPAAAGINIFSWSHLLENGIELGWSNPPINQFWLSHPVHTLGERITFSLRNRMYSREWDVGRFVAPFASPSTTDALAGFPPDSEHNTYHVVEASYGNSRALPQNGSNLDDDTIQSLLIQLDDEDDEPNQETMLGTALVAIRTSGCEFPEIPPEEVVVFKPDKPPLCSFIADVLPLRQ
jgi:hypothetical protein